MVTSSKGMIKNNLLSSPLLMSTTQMSEFWKPTAKKLGEIISIRLIGQNLQADKVWSDIPDSDDHT